MTPRTVTVLSVSDDEFLLATRERVLRTLGVEVVSCHSRDSLQRIKAGGFDLVVLGHSLKDLTSRAVADEVRQAVPEARILLLSRTPFHGTRSDYADAVTEPDPGAVVARVRSMLGLQER